MADEVLLMGTGNDTFVRLATPTSKAIHWVRQTVPPPPAPALA